VTEQSSNQGRILKQSCATYNFLFDLAQRCHVL